MQRLATRGWHGTLGTAACPRLPAGRAGAQWSGQAASGRTLPALNCWWGGSLPPDPWEAPALRARRWGGVCVGWGWGGSRGYSGQPLEGAPNTCADLGTWLRPGSSTFSPAVHPTCLRMCQTWMVTVASADSVVPGTWLAPSNCYLVAFKKRKSGRKMILQTFLTDCLEASKSKSK